MKVEDANYQYQLDRQGDCWIFRYDYERNPPNEYPPSHLHIRGNLHEICLPPAKQLEDIHFPVLRGSIESVIRLLVQFGVRCNKAQSFWRPVLALSEGLFL